MAGAEGGEGGRSRRTGPPEGSVQGRGEGVLCSAKCRGAVLTLWGTLGQSEMPCPPSGWGSPAWGHPPTLVCRSPWEGLSLLPQAMSPAHGRRATPEGAAAWREACLSSRTCRRRGQLTAARVPRGLLREVGGLFRAAQPCPLLPASASSLRGRQVCEEETGLWSQKLWASLARSLARALTSCVALR